MSPFTIHQDSDETNEIIPTSCGLSSVSANPAPWNTPHSHPASSCSVTPSDWSGRGPTINPKNLQTPCPIRTVHLDKFTPCGKGFLCAHKDCGEVFKTAERMQGHLRWHAGIYPWKCMPCDTEYTSRDGLRRHRLQTKTCPARSLQAAATPFRYACAPCGFASARRTAFEDHQETRKCKKKSAQMIDNNKENRRG